MTGTHVYPEVYSNLIERMYMDAPVWIDKWDFCLMTNTELFAKIPAIPNATYEYCDKDKNKTRWQCIWLNFAKEKAGFMDLDDKNNIVVLDFCKVHEFRLIGEFQYVMG